MQNAWCLALLVLTGCGSGEVPKALESNGAKPVPDELLTVATPEERMSSTPTPSTTCRAFDATAPRVVHRDSVCFEPDGYYSPVTPPVLGDFSVNSFGLRTTDRYGGGQLHGDSIIVLPPAARLIVRDLGDSTRAVTHCNEALVTSETLVLECEHDELGVVHLEGRFLVNRGHFFNVLEYELEPTVLLEGRITIRQSQRVVYDRVHRFTYWAGD